MGLTIEENYITGINHYESIFKPLYRGWFCKNDFFFFKPELTINPFVKQFHILLDCSSHLLFGGVEQRYNTEVQSLQQIRQLMDIHHGRNQVRVIGVIQIANKKSYFVCCFKKKKKYLNFKNSHAQRIRQSR